MSGSKIEIERGVLETLVESVQEFWSDHRSSQTEDNPGWVRDRDAVAVAERALGRKEGGR